MTSSTRDRSHLYACASYSVPSDDAAEYSNPNRDQDPRIAPLTISGQRSNKQSDIGKKKPTLYVFPNPGQCVIVK